jgi:drug/metabolite transporter (DMT)-like permease
LQTGIISLLLLGMAFGFLFLRAIAWQYLLKIADLSHVYPFAALVQVIILVYAVVLFHETVTMANLAGLIIMLTGVYFISR